MLRWLTALSATLVACGTTSPAPATRAGAGVTRGTGGTSAQIVPVLGGGGCADTPDAPELDGGADALCAGAPVDISFRRDVTPLVSCSGEVCHQAWTYGTLVGRHSEICCDRRPLVSPGQPSASHLVQAVRDVDSCVGRMGDLDAAQIAIIVAWVCEGAPDN